MTGPLSLRDPRLFAAATLLAVLPLWLTPYLPLVDAPQHAAQVASLHELLRGNPVFTADLEINWFTPYLVGYLLLFAVSSVLPIVVATKVVLSAALIAFPWVTGLVLRELGTDERLKWLAIPGSYSVAFYWGFVVYVVAIPIALALLVLTIRFERDPSLRRGIGIAAFSVLLFFCHVMALGFVALACLTYLVGRNLGSPQRLLRLMLPYTAPLPIIALWMTRILGTEASVQNAPTVFGGFRAHLTTLFSQLSGLDGIAFAASLPIAATILLLPFATGHRFSAKPERWLPLTVGVVVYFLFPSFAQNTAFLYERLGVFLIPLWLMAWDPPANKGRAFGVVTLAILALWSGVNLVRFALFGSSMNQFDVVLKAAEPGRHLAGMLVCNASPYFTNPVYLHFAAWYQAVGLGIADMSFAITHPSPVRYRDMKQPRFGEFLAWNPTAFSWSRDAGDSYDYFLVCAGADLADVLFKDRQASVTLVAQQGPWWLYRNVTRVQQLESASPVPRPLSEHEQGP